MNVEHARAYCRAVGHDPDDIVPGLMNGMWCQRPLHLWMLGAHPELAVGATNLSPNQVALLRARKEARAP